MSVPRSIQRIVMVPSGSGTSAMMNSKNGEISGMLLVNVYAIDFLRLSKIRRPAACERYENVAAPSIGYCVKQALSYT